jgi:hypothetical protein
MLETTPAEPIPLKPTLDADTDQALAWTREARKKLPPADPTASLYLRASARLAECLRVEFPAIPLGRALMSVGQSLGALEENCADLGGTLTVEGLLSILELAAEQLDREEAEAGHA